MPSSCQLRRGGQLGGACRGRTWHTGHFPRSLEPNHFAAHRTPAEGNLYRMSLPDRCPRLSDCGIGLWAVLQSLNFDAACCRQRCVAARLAPSRQCNTAPSAPMPNNAPWRVVLHRSITTHSWVWCVRIVLNTSETCIVQIVYGTIVPCAHM
eukprot:gene11624-biopygen2341